MAGLQRASAHGLANIGIDTIDQLAGADPVTVRERLATERVHRSIDDIKGWQAHALAYQTRKPVLYDTLRIPDPPYLLLDTEYDTLDTDCPVFLISLGVVDPAGDLTSTGAWWAPTAGSERAALTHLRSIITTHGDWPIVTWNGHSADLPMLRTASHRHHVDALPHQRSARHVDLFLAARSALRLPTPQLSLKAVEAFAGIERRSGIVDAQQALATYRHLKRTPDDANRQAGLEQYAIEDIVGLADVIIFLKTLASGSLQRVNTRVGSKGSAPRRLSRSCPDSPVVRRRRKR